MVADERRGRATGRVEATEPHCQVDTGRRQWTDGIPVSTPPLPTRDHQPCRLVVPSVHSQHSRCRGPSRLPIGPARTRTTELKFPPTHQRAGTPNASISNQRHKSNDFSVSTGPFTICSALGVILSKRSTIGCSGAELSLTGRRQLVPAERDKTRARFTAKPPSHR